MQLQEKEINKDLRAADGMHEIVHVLSNSFLISSSWNMYSYSTRNRQPLQPGFYFVMWPAGNTSLRYDGEAEYFGPFRTKLLAEQIKAHGVSRGIIAGIDKTKGGALKLPDDQTYPLVKPDPDRRMLPRKPLLTSGSLTARGLALAEVRVIDISLGGMGIDMAYQLIEGQPCLITFDVPLDGKNCRVAVVAEVAYSVSCDGKGFKTGICFVEIDATGAEAIAEYMQA